MDYWMSFATWVMPTHTGTETLAIFLRWVHITAAITWIGLLYFFNIVNVPFMKSVDPAAKPTILQHLTLPALQLFRASAGITVFFGFWYWAQIYVGPDARNAGVSPGSTIGLFLLIWLVTWGIFFAVIRTTPNPWVLTLVTVVLISTAGWLFVTYTPVGGDDNHVLSIGIGGGIGIFMLMNVMHVIWKNNSLIIKGTLAGSPPANAAILARQAFLTSRANFYLSFPMIFFMAASYHYPILGK